MRWLVGGNYIEVENIASCIAGVFFAPTSFTCRPLLEVTTKGVFGGIYYDVTDKLTLSGELRYQNDQIDIPSGDLSTEFDDVGGRATVEYALREDLMVFANFSRGFRPGGFNSIYTTLTPNEQAELADVTGTGLDVDPETLDQYEIGIKGGLFDGRLQGSAVAYWGEISEQQVQQVGNFTRESDNSPQVAAVLANIGTLGMHGIELEAGFAATERLTLQASLAWNYTEFEDGSCRVCVTNGAAVTDQDHLGNQLFWAPEYTASAVATYSRPLLDGAVDGFARAEVMYESTKYATEMNLYETGDRELVNLRMGVEKDAYRVEFYVANLFDNDTYFNVSRNSDLDTFGSAWVAGLPDRRRVGVRAFVNF
ncbi:MAG: iron complex outermembrane receptor protein [Halieaceae bacterium]